MKDAEKENNFIYHDPVPSKDKLEAIKPAVVAKPTPHDKNKLLLGPEGGDVFEAVVPLQGSYSLDRHPRPGRPPGLSEGGKFQS